MSVNTVPAKVTVIVYNAKGLKPKNKGKHKFSVIFGIGSNKFRTDVIEDLFDNPVFNTEEEIEVGSDPTLPLLLTVTEKQEKDILGQVMIPLCDLTHARTNRPVKAPLRPHKKSPNPEGELLVEAWISAVTVAAPTIHVTDPDGGDRKNVVTAGLKKFKDRISHSPLLGRKSTEHKDKDHKRSSSDFTLAPKGSVSCQDLSSMTSYRPGAGVGVGGGTRLGLMPAESLTSLESISETPTPMISNRPEVTGISPNEGLAEGGTKVTIRGQNLGVNKADVIGLFVCGGNVLATLEYVSATKLSCVTKSWKPCVGNVTVETQTGGKGSSLVQFTFVGRAGEGGGSDSPTSEMSSLSRSSSRGDADQLRRTDSARSNASDRGSGKPPIVPRAAAETSAPSIARNLKAKSMFDLSLAASKNPKPEVTGISPMEGPADGVTKLTIRGLHLGLSKSDILRLTVCGVDCLASLEYESPTKICCVAGPSKEGVGDILVETGSGGKGSSLVKFAFVETKEENSSWAAVPYSEFDGTESGENRKSKDTLKVFDDTSDADQRVTSASNGTRFGQSPGNNARLPPPIVEIQPMRMENKKPSVSPFHGWRGNKKSEKGKEADGQDRSEGGSQLTRTESGKSEYDNKISELEKELNLSDEHIKKLQIENKHLREENERMHKYMENLVNRAILSCPEILCVDETI